MDGKTLLITGGAGFVGSNLAIHFKRSYPAARVISLDNLKRRGSEMSLARLREAGVEFVHGDIRNSEDLNFREPIHTILECSAEPSVLAGYGAGASYMINTNLLGTINCLELARRAGADFVFFSTSRIYSYEAINALATVEDTTRLQWQDGPGLKGWSSAGIDVDFAVAGPRTLYGTTKLCSELLVEEYTHTYNMRAIINRCGVIAGPWQFGKVDQGVFSHWMLEHYFRGKLRYLGFGGKGKQVRDLLHISDLCELVDAELQRIANARSLVYNVGGGPHVSLSLLECTELCREITGNRLFIESEASNRPGDIPIYLSDSSRAAQDFEWQPRKSAKNILQDIYLWIREHENQVAHALR